MKKLDFLTNIEYIYKRRNVGAEMKKRGAKSDVFSQDSSVKQEQKSPSQPKVEANLTSKSMLLPCLLVFRILNACLIKTWFVPDEFWQGPEVAHRVVFGYGYFTWEWQEGLRGYTFPLFFAGAFKLLQILGLDNATSLIIVPRFLQAILAAFGDLYLFKLSTKIFGKESGKWSLFCSLVSWFTFYCVTRTLTNSTETILTTVALYYWPWEIQREVECKRKSNLTISLLFAALSCLIRPTSAIIWIFLAVISFFKSDRKILFIFGRVMPIGILALLWSVCIDSLFYGKLTLVQLNFVVFNVIKDLGTFYGSHPWHWYFTQGLPTILFSHLPLFCAGVYKSKGIQRIPVLLILWVIFIYSFLGHKEFRFIFPILPLCMCYSGFYLSTLGSASTDSSKKTKKTCKSILLPAIIAFLCITNIPVALYTSLVHQKGVIDVMAYLHDDFRTHDNRSVLFLMPCHSTPFYSHLHKNITMRFLECPPNESPGYVDEADIFYQDPNKWLNKEYNAIGNQGGRLQTLPTHVICFDKLTKVINSFLMKFGYKMCSRFFHTHFPEGRIGKEVVVYCQ